MNYIKCYAQFLLTWTLHYVLGQAIGDWYSNEPEQLQFTRGTLFGIVEARADGWYYAIKYDSRLNGFTNEKGYVAHNYVQIIQ
jgi:hypothetical protein